MSSNKRQFTKGNLFNLIRHHYEENDRAFNDEARLIAFTFEEQGYHEMSLRIMQFMAKPMSSPGIWEIDDSVEETIDKSTQQTSFYLPSHQTYGLRHNSQLLTKLEYLQDPQHQKALLH